MHISIKTVNVVFKSAYFAIIFIIVVYLLLSVHAYSIAKEALGDIPKGGDDYFWSIVRQRGKRVELPDYDLSWLIVNWTLYTFLIFPFVVSINYIASRFIKAIRIDGKLVLLTAAVFVAHILLTSIEVFGWYGRFIMD